jgi:hypothetical protein
MIAGKTIAGKANAGIRILKYAGVILLCLGSLCFGDTVHQKKTTKKAAPQLPPLPSGPTGPVPQIPLDSIAPVMPTVSYDKGELTIVAPNSTLGDILRAVRKQTGADIDVPDAKERVVTHLGPGPAREVIAELLNGSRFNYVLLGSPEDTNALSRVVLVAKSGPDNPAQPAGQQPRRTEVAQQAQDGQDANDAETPPDENADDNNNADQQPPAEAEQPAAPPADQPQPGVKTPQQLLQEMQQRQMQMQQQLQQQGQPGQQPVPPTPQQQ